MSKRNRPRRENANRQQPGQAQHRQQSGQPQQARGMAADALESLSAYEIAGLFSGLTESTPFYTTHNQNWMQNLTIPQIPGIGKLMTPKQDDYATQLYWAKTVRDVSVCRGPLERRRKFVISGFQHRHADDRVTKLFDRIARESKLKKRLKEIDWELSTVGWAVIMPDQLNLIPTEIHIMQEGVRNDRVMGIDHLYLEIEGTLAQQIRENSEHFDQYLVDAVNHPRFNGKVPLDGCYFITSPRGINDAFPRSPMYPLFEPLKVIENMVEAQIAMFAAIKQLILHVKVSGGPDGNGKQRPANMKQLQMAARQVFDGARTSTIVTPNETTMEFLSPEKGIFDATKTPYNQAMERIERNLRIPMVLVDGRAEGLSFSTAVYVIKGFLQDVIDERETLLDDFVYPWYRAKSQELYESDPKKYNYLWSEEDQDWEIPRVIFNETELRNLTELLQIAKYKQQTGMYSGQTIMEMFQDDFDMEKQRKQQFNEDCEDWVNWPWEPNQGMATELLDFQKEENDQDREHQQDLQETQQEHQEGLQETQQDFQAEQNEQNRKVQLMKPKVGAPGAKPAAGKPSARPAAQKRSAPGAPGRPAKSGSQPRSDSVNKNPRAGGKSPNSVASLSSESTLQQVFDLLDQIPLDPDTNE